SLRIMRWVHVAESDAEAQERARLWLFRMFQLFSGLSRPGVEPDNEAYAELTSAALGGRFGTWTYDEMIANDLALIGSPASVATQLGGLLGAGDVETFRGVFTFGTMPREAALSSLRLFAAEVVPAVRGAGVTAASPSIPQGSRPSRPSA